ncbi:hypothetical protein YC2023_043690 [Brassica napus]
MTDFQSVLLSALRTADAAETEEGWRQGAMLSKSGSHCLRLAMSRGRRGASSEEGSGEFNSVAAVISLALLAAN